MAANVEQVLKKNTEDIAVLTKSLNGLVERLSKTPAGNQPSPSQVFGVPSVRNGEDPLSSRGFSYMKMLGVLSGAIPRDQAKIEIDIHNRMHKVLSEELGAGAGYDYKGGGFVGVNKFLAPLGSSYIPETMMPSTLRQEIKALSFAGVTGADPDEAGWIRRKVLGGQGYNVKAMSWLNELSGGSLVPPPEMGELIELLRNKEALVNAGARTVPLPPQGRLKYPRQTSASQTYWVGENAPISESQVGTGEVTLQGKKLTVLIKSPNELIRFASPAAEALFREDMTKSLALGLDLAGLEGQGGDNVPLGIIYMQDINRITSSQPGQNGDALVGQDIYRLLAAVEESNAEYEGTIMRPKTMYRYEQLRADAVAQGDAQGLFLFSPTRDPGNLSKPMLAGYPVTKSTQVSQNRTKGNASNLTYVVGGMWSDLLIGMFGAIEFAATTQGDTAFANDQTWVRGILTADIQARHQSAFVLLDNLLVTGPQ